ncbi:MAG: F0F1 ATP synthase subunit B [Ruminococcaceae bacterium]|nr:F0F1 ATP synthase subunit B [Oscillospiraceae bacterium]
MQNLDVISVNLWSILISLANLIILFLIIKKFLYKPVKKMMDARKEAIDEQYRRAKQAENDALLHKKEYEEKLSGAKEEAEQILRRAEQNAKDRERDILGDAKAESERILRRAEENAAMEMKKAEDTIKNEIVDVSAKLSEKILKREISKQDHALLIDDFINGIEGEDYEDRQ